MPRIRGRVSSDLTFIDLFCGAGGSSTGLIEAGFRLVEALNHDPISIATHETNHPGARHRCEDINAIDKRTLAPARVMWGSPICTEISPSGGRRRTYGQTALHLGDGPLPKDPFERTRATALDIIAATEIHRYEVVLCENVIEFSVDWELFDWWLHGMQILGYRHQIVCASSAHLSGPGNPAAPQLRDRMYVIFTREDIPLPDLTVTPEATCPHCGPVLARQHWRNARVRRIGKWDERYDFRCPNATCATIVYPPTRPVSEIIDYTRPAQRVGDGRPKRKEFTPYADTTRERIQHGLDRFWLGDAAAPRDDDTFALVVPIGRESAVRTTRGPLTTIATKPHHGLVWPADTVDDCHLRMISPGEQLLAQRFPVGYLLHGTVEDQHAQVGNAVSVNAAHWIAQRVRAVLN